MKSAEVSFYEWQKRFSSEQKCMDYLVEIRWPDGFQCPHCGHDHGWYTASQWRYECANCYRQSTVKSGTLFHATKLPLTKWFWAIYWISSDKGGISALRLSKLIGVSWRSAYRVLRVLRTAMGIGIRFIDSRISSSLMMLWLAVRNLINGVVELKAGCPYW